jgi:hypothetical protein
LKKEFRGASSMGEPYGVVTKASTHYFLLFGFFSLIGYLLTELTATPLQSAASRSASSQDLRNKLF